ncbi:hypothetical protein ACFSL4_04135, partial [Streptomyces caeni]
MTASLRSDVRDPAAVAVMEGAKQVLDLNRDPAPWDACACAGCSTALWGCTAPSGAVSRSPGAVPRRRRRTNRAVGGVRTA